ncbi:hypothetical protein ACIGO9_30655 [Nocardia asteroides]|uniref:hypothetical protein n=1 Tax=Nocardia asteroides TaxID=1824 RepID=UPI0037C82956
MSARVKQLVAANAAPADLNGRQPPTIVVVLAADVETPWGTLASGQAVPATANGADGGFLLHLTEPGEPCRQLCVAVPANLVKDGRRQQRIAVDRLRMFEEYWQGRDDLGLSHHGAVRFIARAFNHHPDSLIRWGFGVYAGQPAHEPYSSDADSLARAVDFAVMAMPDGLAPRACARGAMPSRRVATVRNLCDGAEAIRATAPVLGSG